MKKLFKILSVAAGLCSIVYAFIGLMLNTMLALNYGVGWLVGAATMDIITIVVFFKMLF